MRSFRQACVLVVLCFLAPLAQSTLVLHQVVEGSSFNKAVFVKNVGSGSVENLNMWAIWLARNGGEWQSVLEPIVDGRELASGETFGVCNSRADAALLEQCAVTSGSINLNGDDAVGLYKLEGTTWTRVDQLGAADGGAGWQQGQGWDVAGVSGATTVQPTLSHPLYSKRAPQSRPVLLQRYFAPSCLWLRHVLSKTESNESGAPSGPHPGTLRERERRLPGLGCGGHLR
eukprot:1181384-Prorocentrum_minimum.AAC.2